MQQHTAIEPKTEWTKSSRVKWVWHWPLSTMRKWLMMNKEEIRYKAWDSTRLVQTLRPTARSFLRCLIRCAPLASYTHIKKPPVKAHFFEVIVRRPGHSHELSEYDGARGRCLLYLHRGCSRTSPWRRVVAMASPTPPIWCLNTSSMAIFCARCALWSMMLMVASRHIANRVSSPSNLQSRPIPIASTRRCTTRRVISTENLNCNSHWSVILSILLAI